MMVFLVMGRGAENIEKKTKTDRRKTLKNEEKEKQKIQGKSNKNNKHLWFYLLRKKFCSKTYYLLFYLTYYLHIIFLENILLTAFMGCRYFKRSNDALKLIWICINV